MYTKLVRSCLVVLAMLIAPTVQAANSFALLAVSWQPAFCELRAKRPECASQTATRYDATHFSLHGLWPGPRSNSYCNVSSVLKTLDKKGRWGKIPELPLDPALRSRLNQFMPGTQSNLQRHEWIKHGTCYRKGSANVYFKDSLRLLAALNASPVQKLFSSNIGEWLDAKAIQKAFDQSFGSQAGNRIKIKCKRDGGRQIISEITIGLYGDFERDTSLSALILAAKPTKTGCNGGIVDPTGLQ